MMQWFEGYALQFSIHRLHFLFSKFTGDPRLMECIANSLTYPTPRIKSRDAAHYRNLILVWISLSSLAALVLLVERLAHYS